MYVNPEIFKAYDIRGDFPEEINAKSAYIIARAFVEFIRGKDLKKKLRVVVASDARPSSPELKKAVLEGLVEEGVEVLDMGFSTTPFHYYTVIKENADGGIMVTASHNAYRSNGLKLSKHGGEPVGDGMEVIKNIAKRGIFQKSATVGEVKELTQTRQYLEFLLSHVDIAKVKKMKVVLDVGGGMTSLLLPQLVKALPCEVVLLRNELFFDLSRDALNPSREEHLATLKNAVIEANADFGVAFDPDGDRSGFVTHNARFFRADYAGAFFAREFLRRYPKEKIVYDIRSSSIFRETIEASGGTAVESHIGHRYFKETMQKENALFGAELSGHFYFRDSYFMDSDFLPFLYFLQFLAESGKTSDELLDEFQIYPSSGEMNFKIKNPDTILEQIAAHFSDAPNTRWDDGLALYYEDWWTHVHLSNTEALLRLNVEARNNKLLDTKVAELKSLIEP